jgi:hypothetical protein
MESVSEFLFTLWTEECVANIGYVLPINEITDDGIAYVVNDDDAPFYLINGEPTRSFRIRYSREVFIDEQDFS